MPKRILIAEDDPIVQRLAKATLVQSGFVCDVVDDGLMCLERLASGPHPDLLLLDLMMPNKSGIQVLEAIQNLRSEDRFPIAVLSGKNETEIVVRAIQLGADDFMVKPFIPTDLAKRVKDLVFTIDEEGLRKLLSHLTIPDERASSAITTSHPKWKHHDFYGVAEGDGTLCVAVPRDKGPQAMAKSPLSEIENRIGVFRRCAAGWRKVWPRAAYKAMHP